MCSSKTNDSIVSSISSKRDPGFVLIVAFSYYDGPESGLAVYSNGRGIRFSAIGDSKSGFYRAFRLEKLGGDWWPKIKLVKQLEERDPDVRVVVPNKQSEDLDLFEKNVLSEITNSYYLGVGSPNFDWLAACPASKDDLDEAINLGFSFVHNKLKNDRG